MSIAMWLGVDGEWSSVLLQAEDRWSDWLRSEEALGVVSELGELPAWTRTRDERTDDVLRALARLASPTGGEDEVAASVLSWLLLPGAVSIARSLDDLSLDIDALVASHLWSNARTFDWSRPHPVAATILRATRRAVQAELGVGEGARRSDRAWSHTTRVEPAAPLWEKLVDHERPLFEVDPERELSEVLAEAEAAGALDPADRALLIELTATCSNLQELGGARISNRGKAGLVSLAVVEAVGERRGRTPDSIRNRAVRALNRLRDFATSPDRLDRLAA